MIYTPYDITSQSLHFFAKNSKQRLIVECMKSLQLSAVSFKKLH